MTTRITRASKTKLATGEASSPLTQQPAQLSSPPATPNAPNGSKRKGIENGTKSAESGTAESLLATPTSRHKRRRTTAVKTEAIDELPHGLGAVPRLTPDGDGRSEISRKRSRGSTKAAKPTVTKNEDVDEFVAKAAVTPTVSPKKAKSNKYGLTPGQTPYPNWHHPTVAECEEVARLLSTVHGKVSPPKAIPTPSLTVSGCGEVPSVLDALIRTRLSAATSNTNSSRAFAGLVSKFGILQEGVGKGSVNWNNVRLADTKDIFEAIKSGGLADVKSKDIKKILQMVWEENQARRKALTSSSEIPGSTNEALEEKKSEVEKAEENVLSLDHLHLMSNDDAFNALTKYPGIGPKTASCVLLFCLQRPSFAVDTHVFRISKWLGWVPPPGDAAGLTPTAKGKFAGPTRNSTYAHLNVKIPDKLKYPLHYLFIKHGKTCPRCRAITGENSEGWERGCVIDHLVQRTGGRKDFSTSPTKVEKRAKTRKAKAKKPVKKEESDIESSEMSDLGSDEESSEYASE